MNNTENTELIASLQVDGSWRKDALTRIIVLMEVCAPWLGGGSKGAGEIWSPPNPWITESREVKYIELLRLGCRCIRELDNVVGIVQFGLNVSYDLAVLPRDERRRLVSELDSLDFMKLFYQSYRTHYFQGLESRVPANLLHPESLVSRIQ